jgi:holo-[acyl-carrier-protein] synthase
MIRGIGTDIVEIDRISNAIKKEFFLKKAFNDSEIDMAVGRKKDSFLAGNFATKEAFVKALGTGFRGIEFKDLAVLRDELGKPFIKICNNLNRHLQGIDENKIHVSISNTDSLAIAMVVIETD